MRALRPFALVAFAIASPASAGDLVDLFPALVQQAQTQVLPVVTINGGSNPGVFNAEGTLAGTFDSSTSLGNLNSQVASQFQRFPVGSTVAAFTFQFDPELNVFRRSTEGLGPLLSDRAQTTGKGKINISFAYSRVEFDIFEGEDLDDLDLGFTGTLGAGGFAFNNDQSNVGLTADIALGPGQTVQFIDGGGGQITDGTGTVVGQHDAAFTTGSVSVGSVRPILDAELDVDVFAFFLNYGITDWLDVGAIVPLLNVRGSGRVTTTGITTAPGGILIASERDSSFGFGDLILRAKARLVTTALVDVGLRGDISLPTGDEDEFRGYGDPVFGPTVILSKSFGMVSPHANVGLNFRTDDPDQHSVRWATGIDLQPFEVLTFTTDVIGEHLMDRDVNVGEDIFAFSGGVKVNPWGRVVLSGNALVRLNDDGLRADVIPAGSIEYTF